VDNDFKRLSLRFIKATIRIFLIISISGCAYLPIRNAMTIENCADSMAVSISKELRKVQGGKYVQVSVPVDAITYSQSDFSFAFQEFLTSAMAKRLPGVVDAHFRNPADKLAKTGSAPLTRNEPLNDEVSAGIVLVSSYLVNEDDVVITTRAIDVRTKEILASTYGIVSRAGVNDLFGRSKGVIIYEK
jgi:hypothetical protein